MTFLGKILRKTNKPLPVSDPACHKHSELSSLHFPNAVDLLLFIN